MKVRSQNRVAEADDKMKEMEKQIRGLEEALHESMRSLEELRNKHNAAVEKIRLLQSNGDKFLSDVRKLKTERNSWRNKAEGLSKEVLKLRTNDSLEVKKLQDELICLREKNRALEEELSVVRSKKRVALAELQATQLAHQQSIKYQISNPDSHMSLKSAERQEELERMVSEMTEYLNAKEMQIETLKLVNEALTRDIEVMEYSKK